MKLTFKKMHGAGNDFVVIDARERPLRLSEDQVRHLADRHRGIGCDQVLVVTPATAPDADFGYRIYNAGGGEVEQCGNGARALALFACPQAPPGRQLRMQSPAGVVRATFTDEGAVSVDMGAPDFEPAALPFERPDKRPSYDLRAGDEVVRVGAVSMGNPHVVIDVEDIDTAPVERLGPAIQRLPEFPRGVNVGFMQTVSRDRIALRVFERGVGETRACGTGACAAAAIGVMRTTLDANVSVRLPGGELMVNCGRMQEAIWLTGPAHFSFEGQIEL